MKVLYEDSYVYEGPTEDGWHVFRCIKVDFDPEIILLERARVIRKDGTSKFYDPIPRSNRDAFIKRIKAYSCRLSSLGDSSMCVNETSRVEFTPKRRVARID